MKYFQKRLISFFSLICVLFVSVLLFNCEHDEIPEHTHEEVVQFNKAQVNTHENVSKSALDFIRTKTNNSFKVLDYKGKITLANSAVHAKSTTLGTVDTDKEIVVVNETNIKHTFKVINNESDGNVYTNLIVVETENSTYEYFLKYILNEGVSIHDAEGNLDFSQFQGRIETYNSEGVLIGDVQIENGNITVQSGQLAPCPDEPVDNTTNTNDEPTDGNDTASSSTSAGVPGSDSGSDTNNSTSSGGWFASSDDGGCGLSWSYAECGCGGTANGHAPSGPDCCEGSPLTITDCNGNVVAQGRTTNNTTHFKRDIFDPCDDGDVGVILDEEDIKESILECINSADFNDTTTIALEILNQTDLTPNDWSEINNYLDENNCSEEAQKEIIKDILEAYDDYTIINELEGKALCVYNKLKSLSTGFKTAIKKFDGDFPVAHLKFKSSMLSGTKKGTTIPPLNGRLVNVNSPDYVITVLINSSNNLYGHPQRPNLLLAKTIIHEVIHAEMFRKLLSLAKQGHLDFTGLSAEEQTDYMISISNDFPGIYDYMRRYKNWQHQQMATHYRKTIAKIMQEFDTGQPVLENENPQQLYMDLSWEGLIYENGNNAIQSWMVLTDTEKNRIQLVISNYISNNSNQNCNP